MLDRDGVINKSIVLNGKPFPPKTIDELEIFEDVNKCVSKLIDAGFEIAVVTNQPDIARGKLNLKDLDAIHKKIKMNTKISNFFICPHDDCDKCVCRKPKAGLLFQAANVLSLDLKNSYLIGDRWRDIEAGQTAGCKCLYINNGYSEKSPVLPYIEVRSLSEATEIILGLGK